ncbi:HNH endonuclease [Agrobacterium vitis]|uniref:HNH endonuclease n=1 Tax=Agrobacterium vitis TaxID=373 RepID=UPI00157416CE|nr:HNH endonuclease [Agrobacterium vitis]NSZ42821.1 HNH endonuclease [Agrobacterium vitis]
MTWGFERGRKYNRKKDIHAEYAGQEQGGIITPKDHKLVIATTGDRGRNHGYNDEKLPDGSFEYYGAGRKGDMTMTRGNKAILEHTQTGESLLLFKDEGDGYVFLGEYVCSGYEVRRAPDEDGKDRDAFVFRLWPLENISEDLEYKALPSAEFSEPDVSLEELRRRAFEAAQPSVPGKPQASTVYERSRDVARYVLRRAKGECEYDRKPAPFKRENGQPYLETHHIHRLSDGGPDNPKSVIALCPNCHRRAHSGAGKDQMKAEMVKLMKTIERQH